MLLSKSTFVHKVCIGGVTVTLGQKISFCYQLTRKKIISRLLGKTFYFYLFIYLFNWKEKINSEIKSPTINQLKREKNKR